MCYFDLVIGEYEGGACDGEEVLLWVKPSWAARMNAARSSRVREVDTKLKLSACGLLKPGNWPLFSHAREIAQVIVSFLSEGVT